MFVSYTIVTPLGNLPRVLFDGMLGISVGPFCVVAKGVDFGPCQRSTPTVCMLLFACTVRGKYTSKQNQPLECRIPPGLWCVSSALVSGFRAMPMSCDRQPGGASCMPDAVACCRECECELGTVGYVRFLAKRQAKLLG